MTIPLFGRLSRLCLHHSCSALFAIFHETGSCTCHWSLESTTLPGLHFTRFAGASLSEIAPASPQITNLLGPSALVAVGLDSLPVFRFNWSTDCVLAPSFHSGRRSRQLPISCTLQVSLGSNRHGTLPGRLAAPFCCFFCSLCCVRASQHCAGKPC